jgi:hypothetical protein
METVSVNGARIRSSIVRNLSRILSERIFKYKNIKLTVVVNSYTHVYISFMDISDSNCIIPLCSINLFVDGCSLTSFTAGRLTYVSAKGFIRDRCRVYKWIDNVIKEYRRK